MCIPKTGTDLRACLAWPSLETHWNELQRRRGTGGAAGEGEELPRGVSCPRIPTANQPWPGLARTRCGADPLPLPDQAVRGCILQAVVPRKETSLAARASADPLPQLATGFGGKLLGSFVPWRAHAAMSAAPAAPVIPAAPGVPFVPLCRLASRASRACCACRHCVRVQRLLGRSPAAEVEAQHWGGPSSRALKGLGRRPSPLPV